MPNYYPCTLRVLLPLYPMSRSKLLKIEEFNRLPNCINMDPTIRSNWARHFDNQNPIVLELGCGKGDISVGLARIHPDINYVGVDLKGVRMWTGAKTSLNQGLSNVAFLRTDIHGINRFFEPGEVDGIWITFPDPYPRKKATKNRMINERFLSLYAEIMKPGGTVWFKTDNNSMFDYALNHFSELNEKEVFHIEVKEVTRDLHASEFKNEENGITTDFERRFLNIGKTINYMSFTLSEGPNLDTVPSTERIALDHSEIAPRLRS